jgi:hypothetical protein
VLEQRILFLGTITPLLLGFLQLALLAATCRLGVLCGLVRFAALRVFLRLLVVAARSFVVSLALSCLSAERFCPVFS